MSAAEDGKRWALHHRGVDTPCEQCQGLGTKWYGSTATWHGGMGGCAMTRDVCDTCWGSGDVNYPWTDLRKLEAEEKVRIAEGAANLLAERCAVGFKSLHDGIEELCVELDKMSRQRRPRPRGFDTVTACLAKVLREMKAATK